MIRRNHKLVLLDSLKTVAFRPHARHWLFLFLCVTAKFTDSTDRDALGH